MMRFGNWWVVAILGLTWAGNAANSAPPPDGLFKDKPLSYWLAAFEPGRPTTAVPKPAEAEEAIHVLGPDVIPSILQYRRGSRNDRLEVIRHACAVLDPDGNVKLVEALRDSDASVRETALEVLPASATAMAIDDIVKGLTDPVRSVRNAAILALIRLAPERDVTMEALIEALQPANDSREKVSNPFSRADAALTLAGMGPKAKAAVPELLKVLDDPNDDAREAAATALWRIEQNNKVIPVVIERLDSALDYQTFIRMANFLGEIGPPAKSAVPVLQKKLQESGVNYVPAEVNLSQVAWAALQRIDPQAAEQSRKRLSVGLGVNR